MENNNRRISTWIPLLLGLTLIFGVWLGIRLQNRKLATMLPAQLSNRSKLDQVINLVEGNYVDEVNSKKLVEDAIPEVLKQLDPHTSIKGDCRILSLNPLRNSASLSLSAASVAVIRT